MLKHPALYCKSYDEYKDAMVMFNNMPSSIEKHNAIVDLKRVVERTKRKESTEMVEQNFAKGVNVKVVKTQYGEIIKLGINYEKVGDNPINEDGWINLDILTSKNGKKYAVVDTYKPKKQGTDGQIMRFEDDGEIPF